MSESTIDMLETVSYQYAKSMPQADIWRNILIKAAEKQKAKEKGKARRTKHLQDYQWQDSWWCLCQMLEKFTIQLLALCLLASMIWLLGVFVVASVLDMVETVSYQYAKSMSQTNIWRNIFINALKEVKAEEGKVRRTTHLQDHQWQDMIEKFTIQLLALCLLASMI